MRHFHAWPLLLVRLVRRLGREVLGRRIAAVVEGRGFRIGAALSLLVGLAIGVVGLLLGVESEVVLGYLAVAPSF